MNGLHDEAAAPRFVAARLPVIGRSAAVPPAGIALSFSEDDSDRSGEDRFDLLLVDADGAVITRLGPFCEDEVVALWRDVSAKSGLPRMIVKEDGVLAPVSRQLGPVALGLTRTRRRHGLLSGRRPRFLVRRKTGTLPVRPLIHRGENEIACGGVC
ncbi:hypothetical protein G3T14_14930 [Methylobacterium sp. BTF04]|uniref:DUF6101 family protein n=1 Tax=Methylobacterium sp. BTF04 TaxID=2708300 RepID=UPI0013D73A15|nr:DUF6101 family protein [Methylobacterium sp. BTF04]NEU13416.1 hypothetical protein [Methylobacterium sp. BTF04]